MIRWGVGWIGCKGRKRVGDWKIEYVREKGGGVEEGILRWFMG